MQRKQRRGSLFLFTQNRPDLLVHESCRRLRLISGAGDLLPEEHVLVRTPRHGSDAFAHAPLANHATRQGRRPAEVVGRSGADLPEHQLFGATAAERKADLIENFGSTHELSIGGE